MLLKLKQIMFFNCMGMTVLGPGAVPRSLRSPAPPRDAVSGLPNSFCRAVRSRQSLGSLLVAGVFPSPGLFMLTAAFIVTKTGRDAMFFQDRGRRLYSAPQRLQCGRQQRPPGRRQRVWPKAESSPPFIAPIENSRICPQREQRVSAKLFGGPSPKRTVWPAGLPCGCSPGLMKPDAGGLVSP